MSKSLDMQGTTPHLTQPHSATALKTPACVVQIYGGSLGRRIELKGDDITIGRDDDNIICVPLHTVSRRHSRLFTDGVGYCVEDLDSTNGTFVNDLELDSPRTLVNGDLIKCGGAVFKFIEGGNVEALYHEEIHRLTITDGLTEIANKRYFNEFLEREIARAVRHHRPLALVMFDIDHFKNVNDEYGHLAGDRVLKGISELVALEVRREELLARWGGEEFAVILPETDLEGAVLFAERARHRIESARFEYDEEAIAVTVSLGVTTLGADDSIFDLTARADRLLQEAKSDGRNRVVSS